MNKKFFRFRWSRKKYRQEFKRFTYFLENNRRICAGSCQDLKNPKSSVEKQIHRLTDEYLAHFITRAHFQQQVELLNQKLVNLTAQLRIKFNEESNPCIQL